MSVLVSQSLRTYRPFGLRTFFASSTDHTRLVKEAEVHCIPKGNDVKQFVLVAEGMDPETVIKVPQLHLARLWVDGSKIYGAKVVNRSLGNCQQICGRLLDAALSEAGSDAEAWSTLHGLSDWVLQTKDLEGLIGVDESQMPGARAIAKNESESNELWEKVCMEFVNKGLSDESNLYREKGTLSHIEHKADTSEFANTCAGSMAVFRF